MRLSARHFFLLLFLSLIYSNVSSQYLTNKLQTNPSGADVLNKSYEVIGKTPFDLAEIKGKETEIYITKEGYDTTYIEFLPSPPSYNFPFSISECEPCRVEMTKENNSRTFNSAILQLKKPIRDREEDTYFYMGVDSFQFGMTDTTTLGPIDGAVKKLGDKKNKLWFGLDNQKESRTLGGFAGSFIKPFYNEKDKDTLSLLRVKAKFSDLKIDFKSPKTDKFFGHTSLNSEWQFFNKFDTLHPIGVINLQTTLFRTVDDNHYLLSSLIYDIENKLLEIDTMYDFLEAAEKKALDLAKGAKIVLKRTPHQTLTNLKEINRYCSPNVVTVDGEEGFGSGFFITNDGYLVTNYHVIEGEKKIKIRLSKTNKVEAEVIKKNEYYDLALLKVKADTLPPGLFFGDSDVVEDGDAVVAIGTPLDKMLSNTLTKGIISGKRNVGAMTFLQTDVSINFGNSGGPLINEKGEVVGMNTMKATRKGAEGIGFAIPSNQILKMLNITLE